MAGDWIKMRLDLQTHPKVVRILSATKSDKFRAIGGLHAVWSVFDTHSVDGRLAGYTPETLDHVIGWTGFADAMIAVGWLACDGEEALILPEFDEHNGKSGKRRAEDQKRKRNERNSPESVRNLSANEADKKLTREEKNKTLSASALKAKPSDEDYVAAKWIFDCKLKVCPSAIDPNWNSWANEIRLMRERDNRTHREMCELFQWAMNDSFWRSNILSPAKLRAKWDQLSIKRGGQKPELVKIPRREQVL
jgi:hypothetical protein